jgi:hypothetical protein
MAGLALQMEAPVPLVKFLCEFDRDCGALVGSHAFINKPFGGWG